VGKQIFDQLTGALVGQQLVLVQVDQQRFDSRTVLHRSFYLCGKRRFVEATATGTTFDFCAMLGHFELDRRDVDNLTPTVIAGVDRFQRTTTLPTFIDRVRHNVIGLLNHFQSRS
jgi:hypothetical protein